MHLNHFLLLFKSWSIFPYLSHEDNSYIEGCYIWQLFLKWLIILIIKVKREMFLVLGLGGNVSNNQEEVF